MAFQEPILTASRAAQGKQALDLSHTPVAHIADTTNPERRLHYVTAATATRQVCEYMRERSIVVVPVYDEAQGRFLGIAHIFNIMQALLFSKQTKQERVEENMREAEQRATNTTIGELLFSRPAGEQHECVACFTREDYLEDVIRPMAKGVPHHVLVRDPRKENAKVEDCYTLLSQTDIAKFLSNHEEVIDPRLQDVLLTPIGELELSKGRAVVCCKDGKTALHAFIKMSERNVPALAICEPQTGRLRYNLSASDLRGMIPTMDKLRMLTLPIHQYLELHCGKKPIFPVTCRQEIPVKEVLGNLLAAKAHRVFVIDDNERPLVAISYTDIFCKFLGC